MYLRRLGVGLAASALFAAGLWSGVGSAGWLSSEAEPVALKAALSAAKEVPRPTGVSASARGRFTAGLTRTSTGGRLSWRLTFSGLTGRAIAAHVHRGRPGKPGPVAVALCGPCRSGARGTARVNIRTRAALLGGGAYVNVHTTKNPAGEIRGQVLKGGTAPPPPTTTTATTTTTTTTYDPYP